MIKLYCLGIAILGFLISLISADNLVFVQVVWRHGDRSPTITFPTDPNQEGNWTQGWGQLTEWGMRQHVDLGKRLRARYVDNLKFLSPSYKSHEIYVRSTDVNRTMISAISNMIAMYPGDANEAGINYPDIPEWPKNANGKGFVPIAIHTINNDFDYTLNADMVCPRQTALWEIVKQTPEYTSLTAQKKDLLAKLTSITGMEVDLTNLWIVADSLFIEQTWNKTWIGGIDDGMFRDINETNDIVEYWNNGLKLQPYQGIDFSIEIPKIRGGSLLWSIIGHMNQKVDCMRDPNQDFCGFFNPLKYYVYSAHDTTIAALFSALGLDHTNWNEDGYPHYSSAVAVELWQKDDKSTYVKFIYYPLDPADNTGHLQEELDIPSCNGMCTIQRLQDRSVPYQPLPSARELCNTLPPTIPAPPPITTNINYQVFARRLSDQPIVSAKTGSYWDFNYNAALFTKDGQIGMVVRVQNLKNENVSFEPGPSYLAVSTVTYTNGVVTATPTTNNTFTIILPSEKCGTEDPRVTSINGLYYLFYTAYDCKSALLSSAISANPFDPNSWVRFQNIDLPQRSWSKSGAALFATPDNGLPQDYLFWGDSSFPVGGIGIALGQKGKWGWGDTGDFLIKTRPKYFDSELVESGASPLKLNTGDFLFIYNSARDGYQSSKPNWSLQYNLGFAILAGSDPTQVLQRSNRPIMSPDLEWEIGDSGDYLTPNVVFLEGLIPDPNGCKYANLTAYFNDSIHINNAECFFGVYGAADSVLGAVQIIVSSDANAASSSSPNTNPASSTTTVPIPAGNATTTPKPTTTTTTTTTTPPSTSITPKTTNSSNMQILSVISLILIFVF